MTHSPLQETPLSFTGPIFDPQQWPFSLDWLPPSAHLVGGSVRDALLGRRTKHIDLDFVVDGKAVETARAIARHHQAGFVVLDAERHIARVVFPGATADFAQQVGDSLEEDLRRRDFTVNAIAYNPRTQKLVDPLQGYTDLDRRVLRMITAANLQDDPLRLLRAYRQAAQLGFGIDTDTQIHICQFAPLLEAIAPERVHAELSYLLASEDGTEMVTQAWTDGLLQEWLPDGSAEGLKQLQAIDWALRDIMAVCPAFLDYVSGWVTDQQQAAGAGRSWIKAAKFACLVSPTPDEAEAQLWRLKCSRSEVQAVLTVLRWMPHLMENQALPATASDRFFFFRDVGAAVPAVLLMARALHHPLEQVLPLVEQVLDPQNPVAHPHSILSGHDLTKTLNLKPGPIIGQLLEQLCIAHAEGRVTDRDSAFAYVQALVGHHINAPDRP